MEKNVKQQNALLGVTQARPLALENKNEKVNSLIKKTIT